MWIGLFLFQTDVLPFFCYQTQSSFASDWLLPDETKFQSYWFTFLYYVMSCSCEPAAVHRSARVGWYISNCFTSSRESFIHVTFRRQQTCSHWIHIYRSSDQLHHAQCPWNRVWAKLWNVINLWTSINKLCRLEQNESTFDAAIYLYPEISKMFVPKLFVSVGVV